MFVLSCRHLHIGQITRFSHQSGYDMFDKDRSVQQNIRGFFSIVAARYLVFENETYELMAQIVLLHVLTVLYHLLALILF